MNFATLKILGKSPVQETGVEKVYDIILGNLDRTCNQRTIQSRGRDLE